MKKYMKIAITVIVGLMFLGTFSFLYQKSKPQVKVYETLEEKLVCYINALIELKQCEFFVFVNLKSVLSDEKLEQIYAHSRAEQVGLLLIEDGKRRPLLPCEKAVIITEDLCEILENYEETW